MSNSKLNTNSDWGQIKDQSFAFYSVGFSTPLTWRVFMFILISIQV